MKLLKHLLFRNPIIDNYVSSRVFMINTNIDNINTILSKSPATGTLVMYYKLCEISLLEDLPIRIKLDNLDRVIKVFYKYLRTIEYLNSDEYFEKAEITVSNLVNKIDYELGKDLNPENIKTSTIIHSRQSVETIEEARELIAYLTSILLTLKN